MIRHDDLQHQLERLEKDGRRRLQAWSRADAIRGGIALALPATLTAAIASLIVAIAIGRSLMMVMLILIALPLTAFLFGAYRVMARAGLDRDMVLATLDHRLLAKGRIRMTDEFSGLAARNGYHDAALDEARPWLEKAQPNALPRQIADQSMFRRRLWCLVPALLAVIATLCLPARAILPSPLADAVRRLTPDALRAKAGQQATSRSNEPLWRDKVDGRSDVNPAASAKQDGTKQQDGASTISRAGSAGMEGASSDGAPGTRQAMADASGAASSAGSPGTGTGSASQASSPRSEASPQEQRGVAGDSRSGDEAKRTVGEDRQRSTQDASANHTPGPNGGAEMRNQAAGGPNRAGQQQQPGGNRPQSNNRSRGNSGENASQSGQSNGSGNNGPPGTQDSGIKRNRGVTGLLLAVPMEDRLTGSANPGRIVSTQRQAPPRAMATDRVDAGDRGSASGEAGRLSHRPLSDQERAMLRNYFDGTR